MIIQISKQYAVGWLSLLFAMLSFFELLFLPLVLLHQIAIPLEKSWVELFFITIFTLIIHFCAHYVLKKEKKSFYSKNAFTLVIINLLGFLIYIVDWIFFDAQLMSSAIYLLFIFFFGLLSLCSLIINACYCLKWGEAPAKPGYVGGVTLLGISFLSFIILIFIFIIERLFAPSYVSSISHPHGYYFLTQILYELLISITTYSIMLGLSLLFGALAYTIFKLFYKRNKLR